VELVKEVFLTAICVFGLAFLAWWLMGRLLRPIPETCASVVIPGRGAGDDLEQTVRSFVWLRSLGLLQCPLIIADLGLTGEGREIALRLAVRWPEVVLWSAEHLSEHIEER